MKVEQTSELITAPNSTIQRLVNAIVGAIKIKSQEIARSSVRDNKFDEFTLPDKISKINMTHALARLSASDSRRINAHLSTYGGRSHMSVHPKPRNAYHTSAHAQFYQCARPKKAATHNWRIQVSGVQAKNKGS
jgi:hypothetical protein